MIFDVTTTHWSLRYWLAFFFLVIQKFWIKVCTFFFRHDAVVHNRLQYSVNITFICIEKPKKNVWLALLWYFTYFGGLQPSPPCLWWMPVLILYLSGLTYMITCSYFLFLSCFGFCQFWIFHLDYHVETGSFISSFPICVPFISFSYLITLARTSSTMLKSSDEKEHICLVLELM